MAREQKKPLGVKKFEKLLFIIRICSQYIFLDNFVSSFFFDGVDNFFYFLKVLNLFFCPLLY